MRMRFVTASILLAIVFGVLILFAGAASADGQGDVNGNGKKCGHYPPKPECPPTSNSNTGHHIVFDTPAPKSGIPTGAVLLLVAGGSAVYLVARRRRSRALA
jgi:hypothetical protein